MTPSGNNRLRIFFVVTIIFSSIAACGQATEAGANKDVLAVSLKMQSVQVRIGEMPFAILTIYNTSDQPVMIRSSMYRVYVYGKDGEAPTTLIQRQITERLRPGDAPLSTTLNADPTTLWPADGAGDSCVRKFQLTYLYDLSAPGTYNAHAEVMDPSSHRWVRTETVTFEMTPPAQ